MLFKSDEFLTANQIAGFFSRLASKKILVDDEQQGDIEVAAHEAGLEELVSDAVRVSLHLNTQLFTIPTICVNWPPRKKLSDFSIAVLKDICSSFDFSDVTVRRKKPYIEKLQSLCEECTCQR